MSCSRLFVVNLRIVYAIAETLKLTIIRSNRKTFFNKLQCFFFATEFVEGNALLPQIEDFARSYTAHLRIDQNFFDHFEELFVILNGQIIIEGEELHGGEVVGEERTILFKEFACLATFFVLYFGVVRLLVARHVKCKEVFYTAFGLFVSLDCLKILLFGFIIILCKICLLCFGIDGARVILRRLKALCRALRN